MTKELTAHEKELRDLIARLEQANAGLAERCMKLATESAGFEARWREVAEQYAAERAHRQGLQARLLAYVAENDGCDDDVRCWAVADKLRELLRLDDPEGASP